MRVGVINYNAGNLTSVLSALKELNVDFFESDNTELLKSADKIIFPGVGEASSAIAVLKEKKLDIFLKDYIKSGKYLLGICLGNQIILDHSEENDTECLGLIEGNCVKFDKSLGLKIPQIGWNTIDIKKDSPIFKGLETNESSFYFVHSYYTVTKSEYVLATTNYGIDFSSVLNKDNIFSVQFHPEKSGKSGLRLLNNFLQLR